MDRHAVAAWILKVDGILLLVVAASRRHPFGAKFYFQSIDARCLCPDRAAIPSKFCCGRYFADSRGLEHVLLRQSAAPRRILGTHNLLLQRGERPDVATCLNHYDANQVLPRDTVPHGHHSGLDRRNLDGVPASPLTLKVGVHSEPRSMSEMAMLQQLSAAKAAAWSIFPALTA